jgi:hypothetical protein
MGVRGRETCAQQRGVGRPAHNGVEAGTFAPLGLSCFLWLGTRGFRPWLLTCAALRLGIWCRVGSWGRGLESLRQGERTFLSPKGAVVNSQGREPLD